MNDLEKIQKLRAEQDRLLFLRNVFILPGMMVLASLFACSSIPSVQMRQCSYICKQGYVDRFKDNGIECNCRKASEIDFSDKDEESCGL